jgi:hypothetical protein
MRHLKYTIYAWIDESASHMTAELCVCARARGPSRVRTERRYCKPQNKNSVKASFLTVDPVNYPEWNPGERVIIRNGERGTDHVLAKDLLNSAFLN